MKLLVWITMDALSSENMKIMSLELALSGSVIYTSSDVNLEKVAYQNSAFKRGFQKLNLYCFKLF